MKEKQMGGVEKSSNGPRNQVFNKPRKVAKDGKGGESSRGGLAGEHIPMERGGIYGGIE